MCSFYILYSAKLDRFYLGHTCMSIEERLAKHLTDHKGFTAKAKDWVVKYTEPFPDKTQAAARERQVKNWKNRNRIEQLCSAGSEHPD
jgi:putative endonuclease